MISLPRRASLMPTVRQQVKILSSGDSLCFAFGILVHNFSLFIIFISGWKRAPTSPYP